MSWRRARAACAAFAAIVLPEPAAALRLSDAAAGEAGVGESRRAAANMQGVPDLRTMIEEAPMSEMCAEFYEGPGVGACVMDGQEQCTLSSLRGGRSTMVYPGGQTRCLSSKQPDYAFQVFPGRRDLLYVLFDGGGAEWDPVSTSVGAANKTWVWAFPEVGFLRRDLAENPFQNYTIVYVQYCSGDLHAGMKTQEWRDIDNQPVVQMGYHNTMSAVNWALANMEPELKSLVVSGVSAGGIAAEVWADKLLRTFKYASARIWADSYIPIFPHGFQGKIFNRLGVCDTDLLQGHLKKDCKRRTITVEEVYAATMKAYPKVGFGSVTSSNDWGQTRYYKLTALTEMKFKEFSTFTSSNFNRRACKVLSKYHENSNFVNYMMNGTLHVFQLCDQVFSYSAEVAGPESTYRLPFSKWMSMFIAPNSTVRSVLDVRHAHKRPESCVGMLGTKALQLQA